MLAVIDLSLPSEFLTEGRGEHKALARLASSVLEQTAQLHHPGYFAHLATPRVGLMGSAPAMALPLAAALLAWGQSGLSQRIERDIGKAQQLADLVKADHRFELWGPCSTGIVVWRPRQQDAKLVRQSLSDAWVSLIDIDGVVWFRCVAVNSSADPQHVYDRVVAAL